MVCTNLLKKKSLEEVQDIDEKIYSFVNKKKIPMDLEEWRQNCRPQRSV